MTDFKFIRVAVKGRDYPSALYLSVNPRIVGDWLGFMASVVNHRVAEPELFSMTFTVSEGTWVGGHWNGTSLLPHAMPIEDYWQLEYSLAFTTQMMLTATRNAIWWTGFVPSISLKVQTELLMKHQVEKLLKELE